MSILSVDLLDWDENGMSGENASETYLPFVET